MIDARRVQELHIVRKVRETIRKWWRIEISLSDASGYVVDHAKGTVIPPHSRFCEASLAVKEGFSRCNRSIERAVRELEAAGPGARGRAVLTDMCHLGLHVIACPIWDQEEFCGALFACGFLTEARKAERREHVLRTAAAQGLAVVDPPGAWDGIPTLSARDLAYFQDLLETTVEEIVHFQRTVGEQERRIRELSSQLGGRGRFPKLLGESPAMRRLTGLLDKIVESDATVLVTGENGTGKELIARALHTQGPRRDKPFVVQNCSALNDNLLESELFGHVRGSFTGATRDKQGLFAVADGGTFFLDEIGDTSLAMQVKLLRVLQEGTFLPVGATRPMQVDVRVIAATNRPLKELIAKKEFREDLFYRLHVLTVEAPPLRQRLEDLPLLCEHFLASWAERSKRPRKHLAPEVLERFYARDWPGNVRELENEIERLAVLSGDAERIGAELLEAGGRPGALDRDRTRFKERGDLAGAVAALEEEMIRQGLVATHWNKTQLAKKLGVSRTTLIKKIKDYGVEDREEG